MSSRMGSQDTKIAVFFVYTRFFDGYFLCEDIGILAGAAM